MLVMAASLLAALLTADQIGNFGAGWRMLKTQEAQSLEARRIHEELLERTGHALLTEEFESYLECFSIPLNIITLSGRKSVTSPDDLKVIFDGVSARISRFNVTHFSRNCLSAVFVGDQTIHAAHQTRMVSGSVLVGPAIPAFSVIKKIGSSWKVSDQEYAVQSLE